MLLTVCVASNVKIVSYLYCVLYKWHYIDSQKKTSHFNFRHNFAICWDIFTIFEAPCSGLIAGWCNLLHALVGRKARKNLGKVAVGIVRDSQKFFRTLIYRVHHAVIVVIAHLVIIVFYCWTVLMPSGMFNKCVYVCFVRRSNPSAYRMYASHMRPIEQGVLRKQEVKHLSCQTVLAIFADLGGFC